MKAAQSWHVFVGTEVGLLKGVDTEHGKYSNLNPFEGLTKEDEITALCWNNASENKVYTGHRNQIVKVFDCDTNCFTSTQRCEGGEGPIKGLFQYNGKTVTAVESGLVKLWSGDEEQDVEIDAGKKLNKMVPNPFASSLFGTGGEENDLKIWDLQFPKSPIFQARNVANDFLDLRVPVWITDLKFRSNEKIITCTRHHQIRLYDTKAQRRPVIDMEFERYPLMCLSLAHNEHQVVVGSSRGRLALIDLRKKLLVHVFKGFAGSIRSAVCHPTLPLVASCGLDRFLRIHDLNKHRLLKKIYLKTRMNCLLLRTDYLESKDEPAPEKKKEVVDEDEEKFWDSMAVVKEVRKQKREPNTVNDEKFEKKKRKSASS